jgi:hypothetical protein
MPPAAMGWAVKWIRSCSQQRQWHWPWPSRRWPPEEECEERPRPGPFQNSRSMINDQQPPWGGLRNSHLSKASLFSDFVHDRHGETQVVALTTRMTR